VSWGSVLRQTVTTPFHIISYSLSTIAVVFGSAKPTKFKVSLSNFVRSPCIKHTHTHTQILLKLAIKFTWPVLRINWTEFFSFLHSLIVNFQQSLFRRVVSRDKIARPCTVQRVRLFRSVSKFLSRRFLTFHSNTNTLLIVLRSSRQYFMFCDVKHEEWFVKF